jgi:hypothetical protein
VSTIAAAQPSIGVPGALTSGPSPVYWIVNLVDEQVEVHTDPVGATYTKRTVFSRGEQVPVVIGDKVAGQIAVSDILPPRPVA